MGKCITGCQITVLNIYNEAPRFHHGGKLYECLYLPLYRKHPGSAERKKLWNQDLFD